MDYIQPRFWEKKSLFEMTRQEWELLCDGCGRCCLEKLKDQKTGKIYYTDLACRYLDLETCRCTIYANRTFLAADCEWLIPEKIRKFRWLPRSCAYRLLMEGKSLPHWHPLISGDPSSVHREGISVRGKAVPSVGIPEADFEKHIISDRIWGRSAGTD